MKMHEGKGKPAIVEINQLSTGVYSLQGDVVALIDGSGNTVVEYSYDAEK